MYEDDETIDLEGIKEFIKSLGTKDYVIMILLLLMLIMYILHKKDIELCNAFYMDKLKNKTLSYFIS